MPKTYIVHIGQRYPFNFAKSQQLLLNSVIKIRRQIKIHEVSKDLSSRILFVNNLRNKHLIKIESIDETTQTIEIGYEYIEMENAKNTRQFWMEVEHQLYVFTSYLTNIGIKTNLSTRRMGLSKQGILKYYLGLQFQLSQNEEEETLREHYQLQLQSIKKQCNCDQLNYQMSVAPYGQFDYASATQMYPERMRKASLVTLPSKMPNLSELSKQLSKIKSSVRQITQYHFKHQGKEGYKSIQNFQLYQAIPKTKISMPFSPNFTKETQRKYSGDNMALMSSNRKLSTKFSDFKGDRNKTKQIFGHHQIQEFNGQSTKTKVEQLKYKQYIQIVSSKGNYLKDFINVLQDCPNTLKSQSLGNNNLCITPKSPSKNQYSSTASSSFARNQTEMLKIKAQQSIKNSLKIISKVRGHH